MHVNIQDQHFEILKLQASNKNFFNLEEENHKQMQSDQENNNINLLINSIKNIKNQESLVVLNSDNDQRKKKTNSKNLTKRTKNKKIAI